MNVRRFLKSVVFGLACLGLSMGQAELLAATPKAKSTAKKIKVNNVSLDAKGVFHGVVLDKDRKPIGSTEVVIAQGKKVIAKTKTDARGDFQVTNLRGGNYQVVVANQIGHVRLWANGTAPPNATARAYMVSKPIVRGQGALGGIGALGGSVGLVTLAAGITTVTLTTINNGDIDDLQKDINSVQNQVTNIANTVNLLNQ
jgi:hypothetical protein